MKRVFLSVLIIWVLLFSSATSYCEEAAEESSIVQTQNTSDENLNTDKKSFKKLSKKQKELKAEDVQEEDSIAEQEPVDVLHGFVEYYPDGTIFFDEMKESDGVFIKMRQPTTYNQYSVLDIKGVNFEEIKNRQKGVKRHISNEYQIVDFDASYTEKIGKFSYGTIYAADIDTGEFEYHTKFFARYDAKHYALQAAYGKSAYTSTGTQSDFIYLTPEWKIGKGFVLKDTFKANTLGLKQENEIILKYTPQFIKENPLDIEVGVGQSYYQDGSQNNVFKFATTLRL